MIEIWNTNLGCGACSPPKNVEIGLSLDFVKKKVKKNKLFHRWMPIN